TNSMPVCYPRGADGSGLPLVLSACRSRCAPGRDDHCRNRAGRPDRLGRGLSGPRRRRRRDRRRAGGSLRRVPQVPGILHVMGVFSTPRPVPARRAPFLAGAGVVVLALPVVLAGGFPVAGWALAATLWAAAEALGWW